MPRDIDHYTECAEPGFAKSHKNLDGLLGIVVQSVLHNTSNFIVAFVLLLTTSFIFLGCFGFLPFYLLMVIAIQDAKYWYNNTRLLCVNSKPDNCAIGTIVHEPELSFDGDRKMDLLLAPFSHKECIEKVAIHLNANRNLLSNNSFFSQPIFFNGTAPALPGPFNDFFLDDITLDENAKKEIIYEISDYLNRLAGSDPSDSDATSEMYNLFMIGFMDRLLDDNNIDGNGEPKNFFGKYYRKDPNVITPGSVLWNHIPEDYDPAVNWQDPDNSVSTLKFPNPYEGNTTPRGLNMLFNFENPSKASLQDNPKTTLRPYLHCEIEGNTFADLMDFAIIVLTAFTATITTLCVFLGPLAALLGALGLALLFWLLYYLIFNVGGLGDSDAPDVEYQDPENLPVDYQQKNGDVALIFGRWIMDTEHTQYLEIHPVKAYYVLARDPNRNGIELLDSHAELVDSGLESLNNTMINKSMADEICSMVNASERGTIPAAITRTTAQLLSYGLNTNYAGGGIV